MEDLKQLRMGLHMGDLRLESDKPGVYSARLVCHTSKSIVPLIVLTQQYVNVNAYHKHE